MRSSGVRGLLIYCADHRCSHSIAISADRWSDDVRLSDLERQTASGIVLLGVTLCCCGREST
jgi:hypothetical protein